MRQLLGKNEQLTLRDLQTLRRRRPSGHRFLLARAFQWRANRFNSNWNAAFLLDLMNRDRAISALQNALDQFALSVACFIRELRHCGRKLMRKCETESQSRIHKN